MIKNLLNKIKRKLFKEKTLCKVIFIYDIKPEYSSKSSAKDRRKEVLAFVEDGVEKQNFTSLFVDENTTNNFTYQIKEILVEPVKTVSCK